MSIDFKRNIDATLLAEWSKPFFMPCVIVKLGWPSGDVRVHSGRGNLTFNSETYLGLGKFGGVSAPQEELGFVPQEATLLLAGPYADLIGEMTGTAEGERCELYLGATTTPGGTTLIGTPYLAFVGTVSSDGLAAPQPMAGMPSNFDTKLAIGIKAGTHGRVGGSIFHSHEDQTATYPTDTLFQRTARATAQRAVRQEW